MFLTYKQVPNLSNLEPSSSNVQRKILMNEMYPKFKNAKPNVLCIGNPKSKKSSLLNHIFNLQFEVIHEGMYEDSACLFHDSIDAVFHSKDFPSECNLFDF